MELNNGSSSVLNIPVVQLKEGKMVGDIKKTGIPTSIVVEMEKMEPLYEQMQRSVNRKFRVFGYP